MLIYRFEDETGDGPYARDNIAGSAGALLQLMTNEHNDDEVLYPGPMQERMYDFYHQKFGCLSVEALKEWFKGWVDILLEAGFSVVCYDAEEWQEGRSGRQVCFDPETASFEAVIHDRKSR